ncbi:MAG: serine hydrolase [Pseudomonadota bacterium]
MRSALTALSLSLALSLTTALAPAAAQQVDGPDMSLVAGYKAAFTCSATFNGGQSLAEIESNELSGIYPDYRAPLASLPAAQIDNEARTVSVRYADGKPPRIAVWREGFGCTQLPAGANASAARFLPRFGQVVRPSGQDRASAIGASVQLTLPVHITDRLAAPMTFAFDEATYGQGTRTSAVVVTFKGEVVAERYARGVDAETSQRTWSVAKSITTTILGAAAGDSLLGPGSSNLLEIWSEGADPRRNITLANLLHMNSGLESGVRGSRTDAVYFGGARALDEAFTRPLDAAPGSRYKYANNDTLAAMRALREAIGNDEAYFRYPYSEVLHKIGAFRTVLETDWNGDFVSSSQVWTTARDLARIGQLYLNNGRWGDEQILHPEWLDFVMAPAPAQPEANDFGYGAGFWLLPDAPGVPADAFAAMGHRGQYVVIVPSRDVVIVRRGYDPSGEYRFDITGFTRDIVGAIDAAEAQRIAAEEAARAAEWAEYEEALARSQGSNRTPEERRARREAVAERRPLSQRNN